MVLLFRKIDGFFTKKRKIYAAAGAVVFALIWLVLWNAFPMPFYSFFFANAIGSNIQLVLLNTVVLLPMFCIFSLLSKTELSFSGAVLLNILLIAAVEYVFSIFMFSDHFYICIIAYILHSAANIMTFGSAEILSGKNMKGMRTSGEKTVKAIKKQPVISIVWAAVFSFVSDAACIALMYIIAHIYSY